MNLSSKKAYNFHVFVKQFISLEVYNVKMRCFNHNINAIYILFFFLFFHFYISVDFIGLYQVSKIFNTLTITKTDSRTTNKQTILLMRNKITLRAGLYKIVIFITSLLFHKAHKISV